jgi:methyl-accepting chemotaxis protein
MQVVLRNITIRTKLFGLLALSLVSLAAVGGAGALAVRDTMFEDRVTELRAIVEAAHGVAARYAADVEAGRKTKDAALAAFRETLHGMRYNGGADYLMAYDMRGVNIAHGADAKLEGTDRAGAKDPSGKLYIREMMALAAAKGEGTVYYSYPKPGTQVPLPKMVYVKRFAPWDAFICTGVYIDDIDAQFGATATRVGAAVLVLVLVAGGITFLVSGNVTGSLARLRAKMEAIAGGRLDVGIEEASRGDEVGAMARSLEVFRKGLAEAEELRLAQEAAKAEAAKARRDALDRMANEFEATVGTIVGSLTGAATEMQSTAQSMSALAGEASREATSVAAGALQASANVQTVSAATTELSASIGEIGHQVTRSAGIAAQAAEESRRTDETVDGLAKAAQKIGEVLGLIQTIAAQTNLLALNATIEAARAGDAGKGFAVVANEVKSLAAQTAKATEEIAAQIAAIQGATGNAVSAIRHVGQTIGEINEIAAAIAAAVEEQNAATKDIARNVEQAAAGTEEVSVNISGVNRAAEETGSAASQVLASAGELSRQGEHLKVAVDGFLQAVRAG